MTAVVMQTCGKVVVPKQHNKPRGRGTLLWILVLLTVLAAVGSLLFGGATLPFYFPLTTYNDNSSFRKDSPSSSTSSLAYKQSYGFLSDISDAAWQVLQARASRAPQYRFPDFPERAFGVPARWMIKNLQPLLTCPLAERIGGLSAAEGQAFVTCDPYRLELAHDDCLVYAIGYSGAWEQDLMQRFPHCEMHIIDPQIMDNIEPWQQQHDHVHWHAWSLTNHNEASASQGNTTANHDTTTTTTTQLTLPQIQERLGHKHRHVDILKIDVGGAPAWSTFTDWIALNATQILWLVEGLPSPHGPNQYHTQGALQFSQVFKQLQEYGYIMFAKDHLRVGTRMALGYLRLTPEFWAQAQTSGAKR